MRLSFPDWLTVTLLSAGVLAGCAVRDEIIATVPADGGGGRGGAGGAAPIVTLGAPEEHAVVCGAAADVATGDVDGDGVLDVLVGGTCLNVLRGDGAGHLGAAQAAIPSGLGARFALGYVDTSHPDAPTDPVDVVGYSEPVRLYLGDGDGGFQVHDSVDAGSPGDAGTISLGQLYGDGALELVTASGSTIAVWTGDGAGGFVGPHPTAFAAPVVAHTHGDFDGDDHADLLVASDQLFVLPNAGDGTFGAPRAIPDSAGVGPMMAVDLDGDGCLDVIGIASDGALRGYENDCAGGFALAQTIPGSATVALAASDLDGDDVADLAVARAGSEPAVLTLRGHGDGSFGESRAHPLPGEPGRLTLADLDGDGRLDVLVTLVDVGKVALLRNTTPL